MASLPQPMVYYPSSSSSSMHTQSSAGSKGSFGPVFAVLAVISFLAIGACIVGRLCARRRLPKTKSSEKQLYSSHATEGDPEKGFELRYPTMKPIGSSRAMIHDIEDGFEIKFPTAKPATWSKDSKGDIKGHPQLGMPKDYAGFKYPVNVVRQAQARGGTFISAKPSI